MTNTHKTKEGIELAYTSYLSKTTTRSCVVLLPGIPYNPTKEYDLITKLTEQYEIYTIHYDGTWGSSGNFLEHNPAISVNDFVESLKQGVILNATGESYENVFIIGTSFGGGLALTLKDHSILKAACLLSPVISYKSVNSIETLGTYLQTKASEEYHFELDDMQALITDQIIFPEEQLSLPKEKLLVFAGEQDDQIPINDVSQFCSRHGIALHILNDGHITFSKINVDSYEEIVDFFDSKTINQSTK